MSINKFSWGKPLTDMRHVNLEWEKDIKSTKWNPLLPTAVTLNPFNHKSPADYKSFIMIVERRLTAQTLVIIFTRTHRSLICAVRPFCRSPSDCNPQGHTDHIDPQNTNTKMTDLERSSTYNLCKTKYCYKISNKNLMHSFLDNLILIGGSHHSAVKYFCLMTVKL